VDLSAASLAEHAPAKINLALHVTGRRPDGFHLIESLAVFTRLGDRVTVAAASEDSFSASGPFGAAIPLDGGNLVIRARDALRSLAALHSVRPPSVLSIVEGPDISPSRGEIGSFSATAISATLAIGERHAAGSISPLEGEMSGRTEGGRTELISSGTSGRKPQPVSIHLTKHLPIASGIGGGSSDAAATLVALNRLYKFGFTPEQLAEIGHDLGADVPMCLNSKPLIARGIGEQVEPVAGFPALPMVLVNPGVPVSTPEVFRALVSRENPGLPPLANSPSPLPSPREGRGEGGVHAAVSPFFPYSGEKREVAATPKTPSPRPSRGEGKGEGQLAFSDICRWLTSTRNDLQAPAILLAPIISEAIEALTSADATFARMSGSGATCFGLFETPAAAARAAAQIQARQPAWWVVATESIASKDPADDAA
jgi:4-diphosphocytidyl-2-C-methyl-D-erythritol kinase